MPRKLFFKQSGLNETPPTGFKAFGLDNSGNMALENDGGRQIQPTNNIDNISLITDQEFYDFGGKQLIPTNFSGHLGTYKIGEDIYHLVPMVEIITETFDYIWRPGSGFYLASFKESGSQLVLNHVIDVQTELGIDLINDYGFNVGSPAQVANITKSINKNIGGGVNLFFYNELGKSSEYGNSFVTFDVGLDTIGQVVIENFSDRKTSSIDFDIYDNIFTPYDQFYNSNYYDGGSGFTVENPHIRWAIVHNAIEDRDEFISYNFKTGFTTQVVDNFQTWWESNTPVPFTEFNQFGNMIIIHRTNVYIWCRSATNYSIDANSYLLQFGPDRITELDFPLVDTSKPVCSSGKIYLVTKF